MTRSCRWDVFRCFVEMERFLRCHSVPCRCCACSALFVGHGCEATLCGSHLLWPQLTSQHLVYLSVFSDVLSGYLPNTCQGFPALYPTLTLSSAVCVCMYVCTYIHTFYFLSWFLWLKRYRMSSSLTGFPFLHYFFSCSNKLVFKI